MSDNFQVLAQSDDPNAVVRSLTINSARGFRGDEPVRSRLVTEVARIVEGINDFANRAGLGKPDCIEITTDGGTTIRINCPVITAEEPTVG